jgi:hypothetical protein
MEATRQSQIVQDLIAARDSLTSENWSQGSYFKPDEQGSKVCMCAHGAVQRVVNPECKKALTIYDMMAAMHATDYISTDASDASDSAFSSRIKGYKLNIVWNDRQLWVRENFLHQGKNYGNKELHYLLGMVGLTVHFNDHPDTTLEMVKNKFDEAIELAKNLQL